MPPVPKPKRERTKHFFAEWRDFRELTQERAIERLGWSQSKISRIERGITPYDQDDLEVVAEAYDCTTTELITVNPFMDAELIDLLHLIETKDRKTILAILKGLPDKTGTDGA